MKLIQVNTVVGFQGYYCNAPWQGKIQVGHNIINAEISQMKDRKGNENEVTSIQNRIRKRKNSLIDKFV